MPIQYATFRKNLTYIAKEVPAQILQDLQEITKLDRIAERKQARFRNLLIGFGIGAFVSLFIPVVGVIIAIILAIAAVIFAVMMVREGRLNVINYRYEITQRILEMLLRDVSSIEPLDLTLILSKPDRKTKQIDTIPHPRRSGWKIDRFQDPWLQIQGSFLDGTDFLLKATEFYQTQYGWKRSSSGKSKYKSKSKSKSLVFDLTLDYSSKRSGAMQMLQSEAVGALQLPEQVKVKRLETTEEDIRLVAKMPPWIEPQQADTLYQAIAMMFLSLYQVLNLAKVLSKKA